MCCRYKRSLPPPRMPLAPPALQAAPGCGPFLVAVAKTQILTHWGGRAASSKDEKSRPSYCSQSYCYSYAATHTGKGLFTLCDFLILFFLCRLTVKIWEFARPSSHTEEAFAYCYMKGRLVNMFALMSGRCWYRLMRWKHTHKCSLHLRVRLH